MTTDIQIQIIKSLEQKDACVHRLLSRIGLYSLDEIRETLDLMSGERVITKIYEGKCQDMSIKHPYYTITKNGRMSKCKKCGKKYKKDGKPFRKHIEMCMEGKIIDKSEKVPEAETKRQSKPNKSKKSNTKPESKNKHDMKINENTHMRTEDEIRLAIDVIGMVEKCQPLNGETRALISAFRWVLNE